MLVNAILVGAQNLPGPKMAPLVHAGPRKLKTLHILFENGEFSDHIQILMEKMKGF